MTYEDQYGGLYKIIHGNVFDNAFLGWYDKMLFFSVKK